MAKVGGPPAAWVLLPRFPAPGRSISGWSKPPNQRRSGIGSVVFASMGWDGIHECNGRAWIIYGRAPHHASSADRPTEQAIRSLDDTTQKQGREGKVVFDRSLFFLPRALSTGSARLAVDLMSVTLGFIYPQCRVRAWKKWDHDRGCSGFYIAIVGNERV